MFSRNKFCHTEISYFDKWSVPENYTRFFFEFINKDIHNVILIIKNHQMVLSKMITRIIVVMPK